MDSWPKKTNESDLSCVPSKKIGRPSLVPKYKHLEGTLKNTNYPNKYPGFKYYLLISVIEGKRNPNHAI
jgi:hypothetical protein